MQYRWKPVYGRFEEHGKRQRIATATQLHAPALMTSIALLQASEPRSKDNQRTLRSVWIIAKVNRASKGKAGTKLVSTGS